MRVININDLKGINERAGNAQFFEGNETYNCIVYACIELFGANSVKVEDRTILVNNNRVTLDLSISYNETKVWVRTFIVPDTLENAKVDPSEIWMDMRKPNASYRFFGLETIIGYLEIKKLESDYITANEG